MMDVVTVQKLAIALGLGLLVGIQREWTAPHVAGLRTFAAITLFGAVCGLLVESVGGWLVVAGLIAVAAIIIVGRLAKFSNSDAQAGLTTQVAALVMYMVGAAVALDQIALAVITGGGLAVLLHWKVPLHAVVDRLGEGDLRAIIQLVLIALVILPVLPDKSYGPFHVLNPFQIWLMVVLICGISLSGYFAYKFWGARAGTLLGGVLGGLISSTATTVSYSNMSRRKEGAHAQAASVIMIASTIVFARILFEVAVVAPEILTGLLPPLAAMMGLMTLIAAASYILAFRQRKTALIDEEPSELPAALVFGVLYAVVLFAVAAVKEYSDERGLFVVAALSGLTDMDAITLSTAQMIKADRLSIATGWRMILVGGMSNLLFKAAAVAVLADRRLLWRILVMFGIALAGGALVLALWPTPT